jgi:hypothetical protein
MGAELAFVTLIPKAGLDATGNRGKTAQRPAFGGLKLGPGTCHLHEQMGFPLRLIGPPAQFIALLD